MAFLQLTVCVQGSAGKTQVAIKCIYKKNMSNRTCDNLIEEIRILKTISSDFIVHLFDFNYDLVYIYLVFEYCSLGDLSSYLARHAVRNSQLRQPKGMLPEDIVKNFVQQLAAALKACHSRSVSHFDLKPQNILISKKNTFHDQGDKFVILKLGDFGFAKHFSKDDETTVKDLRGTPLYMAPEILLRQEYDARADLWSLGVILFEILVGVTPFHSTSVEGLLHKLKSDKICIPSSLKLTPECHDLLVRLLQRNPDNRISFQDFFDHQFLDLEHIPCLDSYKKGCTILSNAVTKDKNGELSQCIDLYLEGLDYLLPVYNFGLPLNDETKKVNMTRQSLKTRIQSYLNRVEVLKTKVKHDLTISQEEAFSAAFEECIHADFLFESQSFQESFEKYEKNLQTLLPLVKKMPAEQRDCFVKQLSSWVTRAEEAKDRVKNNSQDWVTFSARQVKTYKRPRSSRHSKVTDSIGCRVQ